MPDPKTKPTTASVKAFLDTVPDEGMRKDAKALAKLFAEVTGEKAVMWGAAIVGFGSYQTKSGTWPLTAFSPRKSELTLYVGANRQAALLARLGKHRVGGGCLYLKRLAGLDLAVLRAIILNSYEHTKAANI